MRPRDRELAQRLCTGLEEYDRNTRALPGIADQENREVLIEQLLASVHRVEYAKRLGQRELSPCRADPNDVRFDPLKAAVLHLREGRHEEACWLVFLSVHFGKHGNGGWRYLREVYGRLGAEQRWDWAAISAAPGDFRDWLQQQGEQIRRPGDPGGFGNHRKYESLNGFSASGTGSVVQSYVQWVAEAGGHQRLFENAIFRSKSDERLAFNYLYRSMGRNVLRFGRLARFDYLTMLAKLGLASIEPGSTYLIGATGPLRGARLLFGVSEKAANLDNWLVELDSELQVGMQVLEDSLCNWQKSPSRFESFRA
jgi:hypothetical protein